MTKGRPKLSPETKRNEHLVVCLSPTEKKTIEAASQGQPSVWARNILLLAAASAVKPQGTVAGDAAEPEDEGSRVPEG